MNRTKITAVAPIRVCDVGGWTDTWFARYGAVFNIAVYPYVEVQIEATEHVPSRERITINLENFGHNYSLNPDTIEYDKHPLIEAAIDVMEIPTNFSFNINIYSEAPPGASTGTSAAVSVALIGALDHFSQGKLTAHEVAAMAHFIETEKLGMQCGIQDQIASSYGGINYIEMKQYPHASVSSIQIPDSIWWELEQRLLVVYIGTPHSSSEVHKKVIAKLGEDASDNPHMIKLRAFASQAKNALYNGDFDALGKSMILNTDVQKDMHPELVCQKFEETISICENFSILGYKVNGAGGDGGSITILTDGNAAKKRKLEQAIQEHGYTSLSIYLSRHGLRVW